MTLLQVECVLVEKKVETDMKQQLFGMYLLELNYAKFYKIKSSYQLSFV